MGSLGVLSGPDFEGGLHRHHISLYMISMGDSISHDTGASNGPLRWRNDFANQQLALSFRRRDYPAILRVALSPIYKYRSELSLYFYSLLA